MDNENRSGQPGNDSWMDELLSSPAVGDEIGPDEQAIRSANLSHPDDAELDQIMQEAMSGAWDDDSEAEAQADAPQDTPSETAMFHDDEYRDAFGEGEELAQVFSDKPMKKKDAEPEEPAAPVRKVRPRRKKGYGLLGIPHILATAVWAAIILVIGVSLGRILWLCASDVLAFGREEEVVTITITDSEATDMEALADKLHKAGLVRYPFMFKLYADIAVDEGDIEAGTYTLNTLFDYHALKNSLHSTGGSRQEVELMFYEGSTCADVFKKLETNGVCTAAELEEAATTCDFSDYWFLEGLTQDNKYCLEGFLFPDTYKFYTNDEPERVLRKFLNNFENKYPQEDVRTLLTELNDRLAANWRNRGYSEEYIAEHVMTFYDVVIVASMVEKETATRLEGYTISSVIYNRLSRWEVPFLNIDATLIYALGGNIDPETGETKPLTYADLEMDHPYNTYKYIGLTPGPISNPGSGSMAAALKPDETNYFYYALDPDLGEHRFFRYEDDFYDFLDTVSYS